MIVLDYLLWGWSYFSDLSVWGSISGYVEKNWEILLKTLLKISLIFVVGRIVIKISNKSLNHMMIEREQSPFKFDNRRTKTIGKLIRNVISYTVNFIVILLILDQLDVKLTPLLAGAGVLGLAIGFGAQSLVKDVITGFFIIFEDQFSVGDEIQIRTFKGTVEEIGLRVTRIKTWTGEVHIIPNGSIQEVTNYSVHNSLAVVDITVTYAEDIERILTILKEVVDRVFKEQPNIIKAPEVLGLEMMSATEMTIRITAECKANTQGSITRIIKEEAKKAISYKAV